MQTCTWCEGGCASSLYTAVTKFCWAVHDIKVLSCNARVVGVMTNWDLYWVTIFFFLKLLALQEVDLAGVQYVGLWWMLSGNSQREHWVGASQGHLAGGVGGPSTPMTWQHGLNSGLVWVICFLGWLVSFFFGCFVEGLFWLWFFFCWLFFLFFCFRLRCPFLTVVQLLTSLGRRLSL